MASYVKYAADEAGPHNPGDTITFRLPPTGFADFTRSFIEFDLTVADTDATVANAVHSFYLPAGAKGLIRNVMVRVPAVGEALEQVMNFNVLANAIQTAVVGPDEESYYELTEKLAKRDPFPLFTRQTGAGTASSQQTIRVRIDLGELGIGAVETFPLVATNGLEITVELEQAARCLQEYIFARPQSIEDQTGAAAVTAVVMDEPAYPRVDYGKTANDQPIKAAEEWAFVWNEGATLKHAIPDTVFSTTPALDQKYTSVFATGYTTAAAATNSIMVPAPIAWTPVDTTHIETTNAMTLEDCPFFVGQAVRVVYTDTTTKQVASRISEVQLVATKVRITLVTAMAAAGTNHVIYGLPADSVTYSLANARFRCMHVTPLPNQAEAVLRAAKSAAGIPIDIITARNYAEGFGAVARFQAKIPTPIQLTRALAILSVPVGNDGANTFDNRIRGLRALWSSCKYEVNGKSDPLQALDTSNLRPLESDIEVARALDQLHYASSMKHGRLRRIMHNRSQWMWAKPLNTSGVPRNVAGQNVHLEVELSGTSPAFMLNSFTYHFRRLLISSEGVQIV